MKRILITGEHSYIGNSLRRYLASFPEGYEVETISVRDDGWKQRSFSGFDAIVHCAAIVHQKSSKDDPAAAELYDRVNVRLSAELARKAKSEGVRQFVFLSSESVYGLTAPYGKTVVITPDTIPIPKDNYGISKLKAEQGILALSGEDFCVSVLRPPMIYGKGCKGNYNTMAKLALKLPAFPSISNQRSMLYIDNLSELIRLIVENGSGGIICPQNAETVNTCDMMARIAEAHGHKLVLIPGFGWTMKLLRYASGAVDKAFGSLCYDQAMSAYSENYCVKDFHTSILETEK